MSHPSAHRVYLQQITKEKVGSSTQETPCACGKAEETTAHMLQYSQLAHPCSLDDLIMFNDVGKQCTELWKRMMMMMNLYLWSKKTQPALAHSTHPDIITIQETKLTQKDKIPHYTTIRTYREHKQGGRFITLIKDDLTFTNINIPKAINTHNTELQLIKYT